MKHHQSTNVNSAARSEGFTLIELLVVISIISVLVALLLPAVQQSREAARRAQCVNNVKQIGIALHNFHDAHSRLPNGSDEIFNGWGLRILPYLEQTAVFQRFDHSKPFFDTTGTPESNFAVSSRNLPVFLCPSSAVNHPGESHYAGVVGSTLTGLDFSGTGGLAASESGVLCFRRFNSVSSELSAVRFGEVIDGLSQTLMCAEDSANSSVPLDSRSWVSGANMFLLDSPPNLQRGGQMSSQHPSGANGLMADGSVHFISDNIDLTVLGSLATRSHGEVVSFP